MKLLVLSSLLVAVACYAQGVVSGNSVPTPLDVTNIGSALFISAHPDDIEACAGGLVSMLTSQGSDVYYAIITNGDKGCAASFCQNWTSQQIAFVRSQEAINAAAVLNVPASNVIMLDYEDAMLTSYPEQDPRQQLVQQIRLIKPDVIFTWYPYPNFNLAPMLGWDDLGYHPDHQCAGKLALDAAFDAGVSRLWPADGEAWYPSAFYMFAFDLPMTNYVPLSTKALDAKINAYLQHKTQVDDDEGVTEWMTWLACAVANNTDVAELVYAEGYLAFY